MRSLQHAEFMDYNMRPRGSRFVPNGIFCSYLINSPIIEQKYQMYIANKRKKMKL